ncbi:MAG: hypothetical protein GY941_07145 [Planctomycetes bacterium]|nr:hypothetical protein [Planctomycetota bacterium]
MKFIKNTKYYDGTVYEWNLPAGHTCPHAKECIVKVDKETGKFNNQSKSFRCYASSAERFPAVRKHRWSNYTHSLKKEDIIIPKDAKAIRVHSSGDFYSEEYFKMWLDLCQKNPSIEFWAYTKSLLFWVNNINKVPKNLTLTASRGGLYDHFIDDYNLKNVIVVKNKDSTNSLPIDIKDREARKKDVNFCLLDNNNKENRLFTGDI